MTREPIGEKLRRIREQKKISQEILAERSGVKRAHISQIETGKSRSITLRTAAALAQGLEVAPEIFLADRHREGLYISEHVLEGLLKELESKYSIFVTKLPYNGPRRKT